MLLSKNVLLSMRRSGKAHRQYGW